jgi:hypothetical protein
MGTTFTLVDAAPTADAICDAIRGGRSEIRTAPLTTLGAGRFYLGMALGGLLGPARAG